jgi:hypothetical protein
VQNPVVIALNGDDSRHRGLLGTRCGGGSPTRHPARCPDEDSAAHSPSHVANLRATVAAATATLTCSSGWSAHSRQRGVTELHAQHEVAVRRADHRRVIHPDVGMLDLLCDVLVGS